MVNIFKWESLEHRLEVRHLALFDISLHSETALHLANHRVHPTNNTRGHRGRLVQVLDRTKVYVDSFLNRTVTKLNIVTEAVVSAATRGIFQSWQNISLCFDIYIHPHIGIITL